MAIDLERMSKKELEQLLIDTKAAIKTAHDRERIEARNAAEKVAAEFGFSLSELASGKPARARKTSGSAKYANPGNPMQTWTGKGRQPKWFKEAIESGTSPDSLEV